MRAAVKKRASWMSACPLTVLVVNAKISRQVLKHLLQLAAQRHPAGSIHIDAFPIELASDAGSGCACHCCGGGCCTKKHLTKVKGSKWEQSLHYIKTTKCRVIRRIGCYIKAVNTLRKHTRMKAAGNGEIAPQSSTLIRILQLETGRF